MPMISADLHAALLILARMRQPAPADILRGRGYTYEAGIVEEIARLALEELTPTTQPEAFTAEAARIADQAAATNTD